MSIRDKIPTKYLRLTCLGLAISVFSFASSLTAQENRLIKVDGSSTVYPITEKIVEDYRSNKKQVADIKVDFSGTSGGFDKFCRGETDISNASRPIQLDKMEACKDLRDFIDCYLAQAPELVTEVGYVPLPEEAYSTNKVSFHQG